MRNSIKCPCCGNERLIDVGKNTKTLLEIADERHEVFDYYIKCWKCKKEIGIKKIPVFA